MFNSLDSLEPLILVAIIITILSYCCFSRAKRAPPIKKSPTKGKTSSHIQPIDEIAQFLKSPLPVELCIGEVRHSIIVLIIILFANLLYFELFMSNYNVL